MGLFRKKDKAKLETKAIESKYENRDDIKKLSLYITIVDKGNSGAITRLFERLGVSVQFVEMGQGTAIKEIREILGIEDTAKEIIYSFIKKESVSDATKELEAFFAISKRNRGIGFCVPLTSIIGVRVYEFLSNKSN